MKTSTKKTFDAVKFMREQRERLSRKLSKVTKEEIGKTQLNQVHNSICQQSGMIKKMKDKG